MLGIPSNYQQVANHQARIEGEARFPDAAPNDDAKYAAHGRQCRYLNADRPSEISGRYLARPDGRGRSSTTQDPAGGEIRPTQQSRRQPPPKRRLVESNGSALRSVYSVTIEL